MRYILQVLPNSNWPAGALPPEQLGLVTFRKFAEQHPVPGDLNEEEAYSKNIVDYLSSGNVVFSVITNRK